MISHICLVYVSFFMDHFNRQAKCSILLFTVKKMIIECSTKSEPRDFEEFKSFGKSDCNLPYQIQFFAVNVKIVINNSVPIS